MAEIQFGLMMRAQFPPGDDAQARFGELVEQARRAERLGYASITKGMHYSAAPWRDLQQVPFLSRIMAEAPTLRLNFGLVLLSLHMSVQWPGMPQGLVLDELSMLAEEVFPRVRGG